MTRSRSSWSRVRSAGVPGGGRDVRWVRLDGLHLTLRFIGPTLDDRIPPAVDAVRAAGASAEPFDVAIGGAGVFPPHGRPRALWLGLRDGEADLAGLAATVDAALTAAGWTFEPKPFTAHLTLARSDGVPAGGGDRAHLVAEAADMDLRCPSRADRPVREHHRRRPGSLRAHRDGRSGLSRRSRSVTADAVPGRARVGVRIVSDGCAATSSRARARRREPRPRRRRAEHRHRRTHDPADDRRWTATRHRPGSSRSDATAGRHRRPGPSNEPAADTHRVRPRRVEPVAPGSPTPSELPTPPPEPTPSPTPTTAPVTKPPVVTVAFHPTPATNGHSTPPQPPPPPPPPDRAGRPWSRRPRAMPTTRGAARSRLPPRPHRRAVRTSPRRPATARRPSRPRARSRRITRNRPNRRNTGHQSGGHHQHHDKPDHTAHPHARGGGHSA